MFTARAKVCGIIANPVGHSLSPLLHNTISEVMGTDFAYIPLHVEKELDAAVRGAYLLGLRGMNISIPYKQEVMKSLSFIDKTAKAVGAVNTLVRAEDGFHGYNTDLPGLEKSVADAEIKISGRRIIIIGAGGAAKAAAHMCAMNRAAEIRIYNRSFKKAEVLAEELAAAYGGTTEIGAYALDDIYKLEGKGYIAFQSTNIGMTPDTGACVIEDDSFYSHIEAGVDLIYTPAETVFLRKLRERGALTLNGLEMLINQGIIAWELWNPGMKVSEEARERAKTEMRRALSI